MLRKSLNIALAAAVGVGTVVGAALWSASASAEEMWVRETGLVPYKIVDNTIPEPLTDKPGDPVNGRAVAIHRQKGNCLTCHVMPIPEQQFHGDVAPDLTTIGSRMSKAELRMRLVNPKVVNPETQMMSFYRVDHLHRPNKKFIGKPMLTAQEVEDVVAYLATLK